jgi:hypothetical protein
VSLADNTFGRCSTSCVIQENMVTLLVGHNVLSDGRNPFLMNRDSTQAVAAQPDFNQVGVKD